MSLDSHVRRESAARLLMEFGKRTGLEGGASRRYLWTDAFAVCGFLGLARVTGQQWYQELALVLVERVHAELGRYREDDVRKGWLSGLKAEEGEAHPTRGGLRIGKPLPERMPREVFDEELEWDRDGQYFHYLTKWMIALDRVAHATRAPTFNLWARELAAAAHDGFVCAAQGNGPKQMHWKMSVDLSRPLVASMGQHDPLDGYLTCLEIMSTSEELPSSPPGPDLAEAAADFRSMIEPHRLASADSLGIGGLLVDAHRLADLSQRGVIVGRDTLLGAVLEGAVMGLQSYLARSELRLPAPRRLAFRELGLAIGISAVEKMARDLKGLEARGVDSATRALIERLAGSAPLRASIEAFWLRPENRRTARWTDYEDINDVMLATSLEPDGFLSSQPNHRRAA